MQHNIYLSSRSSQTKHTLQEHLCSTSSKTTAPLNVITCMTLHTNSTRVTLIANLMLIIMIPITEKDILVLTLTQLPLIIVKVSLDVSILQSAQEIHLSIIVTTLNTIIRFPRD